MLHTSTALVLAMVLGAPIPKQKPKSEYIGYYVCCKESNVQTYRLRADQVFVPDEEPSYLRYIDVRVVDEKEQYVAVQADSEVIWLKKSDVLKAKDAVDHFLKVLETEKNDQRAVAVICWAYMAIHDYDNALKFANRCVELSPNSIAWKNNRGEVYNKRKEYSKAIEEFTSILNKSPTYFFALYNRSEAYMRTGKFQEALDDINNALENHADVPGLFVNQARVLSIASDAKLRDGKKAIEIARKAGEVLKFKDGYYFDTLAAAYAEVGDFEKAVDLQTKAMADPDWMKREEKEIRLRLDLYRNKKPYHFSIQK
ncbi:MAG: hypothetical protein R3B84_14365 [Zavarzinella sp.]